LQVAVAVAILLLPPGTLLLLYGVVLRLAPLATDYAISSNPAAIEWSAGVATKCDQGSLTIDAKC